jgi:hypothetical protein
MTKSGRAIVRAKKLLRRALEESNMPDNGLLSGFCPLARKVSPGNCSGLLKFMASMVGVYLPDKQANDLIDFMATYWTQITEDQAQDYADQGRFVVAGKKNQPNGHVVVIMSGGKASSGGYQYEDSNGETQTAANHGQYPRACSTGGGWPGAESEGDKSVYDSWGNKHKYAAVKYWLAPLPGTEVCKK